MTWPGRDSAAQGAARQEDLALIADPASSVSFEDATHAVVEGDNLDVLTLLIPAYAGAVQLVFLDPPYNTGRDLAYRDAFGSSADWLSMMEPRLILARQLLAETGFCVVTLDDGEVAHLRLLMDEVFGRANFVGNVVWQKAYVANQTARLLSNTHDHVLVYARHAASARMGRLPRTDRQLAAFRNPDADPRGPWKAENLSSGKPYARGSFAIVTPHGRVVRPPAGRWWRCSEARYQAWLREGRIWFGVEGRGRPMLKKYASEVRDGLTPSTWWSHDEVGTNKEASIELKRLFGGRALFETPKPLRLLQRILALFCPDGGVVVDPFAGTGTTAHAAMSLRRVDGRPRPTVLIQRAEPTAHPDLPTLAHVCRERVRLAAATSGEPGFRSFQVGPAKGAWPIGLRLDAPRDPAEVRVGYGMDRNPDDDAGPGSDR